MVLRQELLLPFKPRVNILMALEDNGFIDALGKTLKERAKLLASILGTDTQLQ